MRDAHLESYPFSEHLSEVRSRLIICCLSLVIGTISGYLLYDHILSILLTPIDQPLYYTSPAGGLDFAIKISLFFGCLVSIPIVVYQVLRFIGPAFSNKLRHFLPVILFFSCVLLLCGMLFAYYISLPAALYFLNKFSTDQIHSLISTTEYLNFITRYILGFGIVFQLPLILIVINYLHTISIKTLMSNQRWVILVSFTIAAILTPTPDIFNQLVMAGPLILLYELSIFMIWFINKDRK